MEKKVESETDIASMYNICVYIPLYIYIHIRITF